MSEFDEEFFYKLDRFMRSTQEHEYRTKIAMLDHKLDMSREIHPVGLSYSIVGQGDCSAGAFLDKFIKQAGTISVLDSEIALPVKHVTWQTELILYCSICKKSWKVILEDLLEYFENFIVLDALQANKAAHWRLKKDTYLSFVGFLEEDIEFNTLCPFCVKNNKELFDVTPAYSRLSFRTKDKVNKVIRPSIYHEANWPVSSNSNNKEQVNTFDVKLPSTQQAVDLIKLTEKRETFNYKISLLFSRYAEFLNNQPDVTALYYVYSLEDSILHCLVISDTVRYVYKHKNSRGIRLIFYSQWPDIVKYLVDNSDAESIKHLKNFIAISTDIQWLTSEHDLLNLLEIDIDQFTHDIKNLERYIPAAEPRTVGLSYRKAKYRLSYVDIEKRRMKRDKERQQRKLKYVRMYYPMSTEE